MGVDVQHVALHAATLYSVLLLFRFEWLNAIQSAMNLYTLPLLWALEMTALHIKTFSHYGKNTFAACFYEVISKASS